MSTTGYLDIESMKDRCTAAEWQARVDLAACYRLVAIYGMSDMMANHISARVPDEDGAFLINAYGMMYEEITASSLIKIDHDGNILSKPDFGELDYGVNVAGYVIHSAVHEARPEVACVIHTHSWASMAVSALECGLLPITQTGMRFLKIGYHDYEGVVLDLEMQERLVRDLGDNNALILRNAIYGEALAQSLAAGHDAKAAAAALLPTLSLEAVATRRDIGSGATPGLDKTIGLVLRQNFYTGGADTARKNQADQRAVEDRLALDTLRRQLERAIGQTQADARYADSLITARKEAVLVAAAAFESVREQFAFRRGTLLDLLRAQEDLDLAGRDLIDVVVDHALARYRLLHLAMELTPLFDLGAPQAALQDQVVR